MPNYHKTNSFNSSNTCKTGGDNTCTQMSNSESNYQQIKINVDNLKVIQIGFTLSDKDGLLPPEYTSWQFNFKFDLKYIYI